MNLGASFVRRNFLASTALTTSSTLIAGAALAADLPLKAPPLPTAAPFSWTGCYVGANAGGGWVSTDESVTTAAPFLRTFDSSGRDTSFTGGGQLGCNWQFDPSWVVGLEGDINYIHASRSQSFRFRGEDTVQQTRLRWLATVRGRFGYAWGPSYLYATGGLALGDVNSSVIVTSVTNPTHISYSGSSSATRAGWTVGAGFEHAFTNRLSLKLEYLHFDLGEANYGVPRVDQAIAAPWTASAKVSGDIVRAGINYKFFP
jgi:outer membrane immunogenic protein